VGEETTVNEYDSNIVGTLEAITANEETLTVDNAELCLESLYNLQGRQKNSIASSGYFDPENPYQKTFGIGLDSDSVYSLGKSLNKIMKASAEEESLSNKNNNEKMLEIMVTFARSLITDAVPNKDTGSTVFEEDTMQVQAQKMNPGLIKDKKIEGIGFNINIGSAGLGLDEDVVSLDVLTTSFPKTLYSFASKGSDLKANIVGFTIFDDVNKAEMDLSNLPDEEGVTLEIDVGIDLISADDVCVYYDKVLEDFYTDGLTTLSVDLNTGILTCLTSHLSDFSVINEPAEATITETITSTEEETVIPTPSTATSSDFPIAESGGKKTKL
jgi:hypothetical protein